LAGVESLPPERHWTLAAPALSDPVRAVRFEAVRVLAEGPPPDSAPADATAFAHVAEDYEASLRRDADRVEGRSNLARFYARQGRAADAEAEYLAALRLDFAVGPRVDLADLYRAQGREADAERVLRDTLARAPDAAAARHALGLLLVRSKDYPGALAELKRAAELDPGEARYAYVYAVALTSTGQTAAGRAVLEAALAAHPSDIDILGALLNDALQSGDAPRALPYAERLSALLPDNKQLGQLVSGLKAAEVPR
jgi:tetratricopeptide (TPR) repeat protein